MKINDLKPETALSVSLISVTSPGIADGVTPVTITIVIRQAGVLVANVVPEYAVSGTGNTAAVCTPTNAMGVSTCLLTSTVPEVKTISLLVPASELTASVTFNPYLPPMAGFAITSGGGITSGGAISSHSSIGLPTTPIRTSGGSISARTGLHGVLYEQ